MEKFKEILFLSNIKGIGPVSLNKTYIPKLSNFKDFDEFKNSIKEIIPLKFQNKDTLDNASKLTEEVCSQISSYDITPITVLDKNYPTKLKDLKSKTPPILYTKGNIDILSQDAISVIGTRNPTRNSSRFERAFVEEIIKKTGSVIVSGLAIGCDSIAHKTAVDMNHPTVAVLPGGVCNIMPRENIELANEIIETGGCLISSYRPFERVHRTAYITRDQYTAALSDCCIVVECEKKSGTMYTVNYAKDLNRKIAVFNADFSGNNYILKEYNAIKISGLEDIEKILK